jgi:hypothetical protein
LYIRVLISGSERTAPVNLFINLNELDDVTATGIFSSLICHLLPISMTEEYLNDYLVFVACDGVKKLLKETFLSIIVWHCANHTLKLAVHDAVKTVSGINRFKSFIDKLYVLYHASPENSANSLEMQLLKIGRILSACWVAFSFHSVSAVWQDYEALVRHFTNSRDDCSRDKKDRSMYEVLLKKITTVEFVLDLGLMCDTLQELSELSLELQKHNINLYSANNKTINVLLKCLKRDEYIPDNITKHPPLLPIA